MNHWEECRLELVGGGGWDRGLGGAFGGLMPSGVAKACDLALVALSCCGLVARYHSSSLPSSAPAGALRRLCIFALSSSWKAMGGGGLDCRGGEEP
jgi:hypothetical protein